MAKKKIDEKKQIIYLLIILIVLLVFTCLSKIILSISDDEEVANTISSSTQNQSNTQSNASDSTITYSKDYTINGRTQEEWEKVEAFTNEDVYEYVMELFEAGLSENITIDTDSIISGEVDSSDLANAISETLENY